MAAGVTRPAGETIKAADGGRLGGMAPELLSEAERRALVEAVAAAERQSGAEIVPVLSERSDRYAEAEWAATAIGALVGGLATLVAPRLSGWRATPVWLDATLVAAFAFAGALLARVPALRRALAGGSRLDARVDAAANLAFVEQQVFRTRDRTGILLFVSRFERQVRVLADEAVYQAVERREWERLAAEVAAGMGRRPPGEALLAAVRRTGELVTQYGPVRRDDDVNELPDEPVTRP